MREATLDIWTIEDDLVVELDLFADFLPVTKVDVRNVLVN